MIIGLAVLYYAYAVYVILWWPSQFDIDYVAQIYIVKKVQLQRYRTVVKSYFLVERDLKPFPISKGPSLSKNSTFWNVPSDATRRNEFKLPQSCNLRITQSSSALKRDTVGSRSKILFYENSTLNDVIREALSESRRDIRMQRIKCNITSLYQLQEKSRDRNKEL